MTYEEALTYIHRVASLGSKPGLERIEQLCEHFGHPERNLKCIHIAGTNGKGSVSSMISEVLMAEGKKVGLFTSPFIYKFNERFRINGECISNEKFAEIITEIAPFADSMKDRPSEFELDCIVGFLWFFRENCDAIVLECGLGGRLDGTNVIEKPLLSVITGIALDHTDILGDTTEKIAWEKAGIIKEGCPVLIGRTDDGAQAVIIKEAASKNSAWHKVDYSSVSDVELSLSGCELKYGDGDKYFVSLCGAYQPENAAVAISALRILGVSDTTIREGLGRVRWPARFEVMSRDPLVIYDGGHNSDGVAYAVRTVKELKLGKMKILTGVLKDKDYEKMTDLLVEIAETVYCMTPPSPRALSSDEYASVFEKKGVKAVSLGSIENGVKRAVEETAKGDAPLLIIGSLYSYRDVKDALADLGIIRD